MFCVCHVQMQFPNNFPQPQQLNESNLHVLLITVCFAAVLDWKKEQEESATMWN